MQCFYTVYKITNLVNNKYYIGKHKTSRLDDGYMGSGKLIRQAIKKHGLENFKKEILFVFETEDEMNAKEAELVVLNEDSYNLCEGGQGGFSYINSSGISKFKGKSHSEESKKLMGHAGNQFTKGMVHSEETKEFLSKNTSAALKGKPKSEEHRRKISEALKKKKLRT